MKSAHQLRIETFMKKAGQRVPDSPILPDEETRLLRAKLILEEAFETIHALGVCVVSDEQYKEIRDVYEKTNMLKTLHHISDRLDGFINNPWIVIDRDPDLEKIVDGCADLSVVTIGTLSACGVNSERVLEEVDAANLRKFENPFCPKCKNTMHMWAPLEANETQWRCTNLDCSHTEPLSYGPHRREDGKWMKGKSFAPPNIKAVLRQQGWKEETED